MASADDLEVQVTVAKPIFIVGLPKRTELNQMESISSALAKKLHDYHVISYIDENEEAFSFKTFYAKDWQLSCTHGIKEMIAEKLGIPVPVKKKGNEQGK